MNTYPKYGKSNDMNMPLNSYGMNVMLNNSFSKLLFDIIDVDKISHICTKEVLNNEINNIIGQFKNLMITSLDTPILVDISEVFNNIDLKYIKSHPISYNNYTPLCGIINSNNPKDIIATDIKINSEKIYNMTLVLSEKYDFKLIMDPLFDNRVTGLPIYLCILKDSYKLVISNSTNVLIITKYKNQDRFAYVIYTVSDGKHTMSESYIDYSYPHHVYNIEDPVVSKSTEFYSYDEEDEETDIEYKHNVVTTKYSHDTSKGFDYKDPRYRDLANMNSRVKIDVKTIMDASDIGMELSNVADIMVNSYDDSTTIKYELIKNNTTVFYDNKNLTECKSIVEKLITECKSTIEKDQIKYSEDLKEPKLYKESIVREILSKATDIKYITLTKLLREKVSSKEKEGTSTNTMALAIRVVYYINDNIAELIVYHAKDRFKSWLSSTIEFGKDTSHSYSIVNTKYKGFSDPDIVRSFILTDDTTNNLIKSITYSVHLLNSKTLNLYDIPNKLVYCTKVGEDKFTVADMENIIVLKNKMSSSKEIIVRDLK